jgi:predicted esterase
MLIQLTAIKQGAEKQTGHALADWMLPVFPNLMKTNGILTWLMKPYYIVLALYGGVPFFYYNRLSLTFPNVKTFMIKLRESQDPKEKDMPIGAAGFCWGGKHLTLLAQKDSVTSTGKPLVDAVFTGHPSMLSLPADVDPVNKPFSLAIGDRDPMFPMKDVEQLKKIFAEKTIPSEVEIYPGAGHGFCVRGDREDKKLLEHSLMAEDQAVKWFQTHLKSTPA